MVLFFVFALRIGWFRWFRGNICMWSNCEQKLGPTDCYHFRCVCKVGKWGNPEKRLRDFGVHRNDRNIVVRTVSRCRELEFTSCLGSGDGRVSEFLIARWISCTASEWNNVFIATPLKEERPGVRWIKIGQIWEVSKELVLYCVSSSYARQFDCLVGRPSQSWKEGHIPGNTVWYFCYKVILILLFMLKLHAECGTWSSWFGDVSFFFLVLGQQGIRGIGI